MSLCLLHNRTSHSLKRAEAYNQKAVAFGPSLCLRQKTNYAPIPRGKHYSQAKDRGLFPHLALVVLRLNAFLQFAKLVDRIPRRTCPFPFYLFASGLSNINTMTLQFNNDDRRVVPVQRVTRNIHSGLGNRIHQAAMFFDF